jgi:two-component system sensor histidine kinase CiaH
MSRMFAGTRWRLVGWTMAVVALILGLVGVAIYGAMSRTLIDQVDRALANQADAAMGNPGFLFGPGGGPRGRDRGVFYLVLDADGSVVANPQNIDASDLRPPPRAGGPPRPGFSANLEGVPVRLHVRPLPPNPRFRNATLVVGQTLFPEHRALGLLLIVLVGAGLLGLLLSFVGAWFLAGRALVPIQRAFQRQQEFVADASHELRTPLTVLRSATDLLHQHRDEPLAKNADLFDDVRAEIGRLQRLTQDLLTLARSDRGQLELAVAPLDLGELAGEVVRRTTPLAQERGVELMAEVGEAPLVEVDPDRIQQVLLILLDNALKHTPTGGRVVVSLGVEDRYATLAVADTGAGIAPEHLSHVFERFYRADNARTRADGGSGLGLAIARMLVEAHGGELKLASQLGVGTTATVRLPLGAEPRSLPARLGQLASRITHAATR